MTLSYSLRLVYFCFACFFLVHAVVTICVRGFAARAIARAEKMNAARAARFLLALRLSPAAAGLLAVAGFCVPSYLWLEPDIASEDATVLGLIAAIAGLAMGAGAILRALLAAFRAREFARECARIGVERGGRITIPHAGRLMALVGVFRPRLIVSSDVEAALDPQQFDAALRHEGMHQASRDNLKQLLMLLAPGWFLRGLEHGWKKHAECAADDRAAAGDPQRAIQLASALVRVARIRPGEAPPALATSLLREQSELAARVERLLEPPPAAIAGRSWKWPLAGVVAALALLSPPGLSLVHRILERLMD